MCPALEKWATGKGEWLLIHAPPGVGKSLLVSERLPAYILGCDPLAKVFLSCYNIEKATEFGDIVKQILSGEDHRAMFPDDDSWVDETVSSRKFKTPARERARESQPSFQAMGLQSGFTGKHPTHLIIDDPYKGQIEAESPVINERNWRWWSKTAEPRIADDTNVLVMYHTYHVDDMAARMKANYPRFKVLRFPILADANTDGCDPTGRKEGEPLSPLRSKQWCVAWQARDPEGFAGQGQGTPVIEGDVLINPSHFIEIDWEDAPECDFYFRGYDYALKDKKQNDETATAIGGTHDNAIYVFDMDHWRRDTPLSVEKTIEYFDGDPPGTFICMFDEVVHLTFIQQLRYHYGIEVEEAAGCGNNKYARFGGMNVMAKQRRVYFVRHPKPETLKWIAENPRERRGLKPIPVKGDSSWISWIKNQMFFFRNLPTGTDDGIDALSALHSSAYKHVHHATPADEPPKPGSPRWYREHARSAG